MSEQQLEGAEMWTLFQRNVQKLARVRKAKIGANGFFFLKHNLHQL